MEKNSNQNSLSFIPQAEETFVFERRTGSSVFFKFSIFLFFVSFIVLGLVLSYKVVVARQINELSVSIDRAKASFDPNLISKMGEIENSIAIVDSLLTKHLYPLNVFNFFESVTLPDVRFGDFSFGYVESVQNLLRNVSSENGPGVSATLKGEAKSFLALAQQSEILDKNEDLKNFSFSNFSLTPEGNVSFNLSVNFNPTILWQEK